MARAGRPKAKLELTENERAQLLRWSRRQKSSPAQTGVDLLTDKQVACLEALFADEQHSEVEVTWGIYQRLVVADRQPDKKFGRSLLNKEIDDISTGVPTALVEIRSLGRTLNRRAADVLAFFDRPGTSNSPHRGHQRPTRAPPRYRPGLPEPDPLHRPQPPRSRRIQTPTTPSITKSPFL